MCRGRGAVVFCPGGRLVFQRSWGGSESEEPAERNLASVSCHRWLLSESARISLCVVSTRRAGAGFPQTQLSVEQASRRWRVIRCGPARVELVARPQHRRVLVEDVRRWNYALALNRDDGATLDDLRESSETLEAVAKSWKRVYGDLHPETRNVQSALATAREKLADARVRVQAAAVS